MNNIIRTKYINLLGYNIQGNYAILCRYCKKWSPTGAKYELREKIYATYEYCQKASIYYNIREIYSRPRPTSCSLRSHEGYFVAYNVIMPKHRKPQD